MVRSLKITRNPPPHLPRTPNNPLTQVVAVLMKLASIAGKAHLLPVPSELPYLNDMIAFTENYNAFVDGVLSDRSAEMAAAAAAAKAATSYLAKTKAMFTKKAITAARNVEAITEVCLLDI